MLCCASTPGSSPARWVRRIVRVQCGFTSTGAAAFEPTITTSGFQERGIVLGSTNPDTLSQWYRQDGTPANVLTGMNRVR